MDECGCFPTLNYEDGLPDTSMNKEIVEAAATEHKGKPEFIPLKNRILDELRR
jgi:hypothetical protein